jgi:uncharacterized protein
MRPLIWHDNSSPCGGTLRPNAKDWALSTADAAALGRFLRQHGVETVVARHMGEDMCNMITRMRVTVRLGATGEARQAVATTWQSVQPGRTRPPVPPNHPTVDGLA